MEESGLDDEPPPAMDCVPSEVSIEEGVDPEEPEVPPTDAELPDEVWCFGALPPMVFTESAYRGMMNYLTSRPPELGGALLGPQGDELVTHFVPDLEARTSAASYTPNVAFLGGILQRFMTCGLDCKGIAHSHPLGCTRPSHGDLIHVRSTFARPKNAKALQFLLPIVCGERVYPYIVFRAKRLSVVCAQLVLV
jgi:hypothetical protein